MDECENRERKMHAEESDDRLVYLARAGDGEAFGRLVARHRPLVLGVCRRQLSDVVLAEDAVQESALHALRRLDTLRRADRFGPWLAGIALNLCRMWQRSSMQERRSWDVASASGRIGSETQETDRWAETIELRTTVQQAVNTLPEGQRAAISLFYLADLSYAETAESLGIDPGAVRTRLHKGRGALRSRLRTVYQEEYMTTDDQTTYICSFCGKGNNEVRRMIAGPEGAIICNECVDKCNALMAEEEARTVS